MNEMKVGKGSEIKQRDLLIPNEDLLRCAENEEPMFLNLILRKKEILDDVMINSNIEASTFLIANYGRFFGVIAYHYSKYNCLLTEAAYNEIIRDSPTQANDKIFYDKIYRFKTSEDDFQRLKKNLINRCIQQKFYETSFGLGKEEGLVEKILSAKEDQPQLISKLQDKLTEINSQFSKDGGIKVSQLTESLDKLMNVIDDRRRDPDSHWGFKTGYKGIDDVIFGIKPGKYAIVVGYPNGGKTTTLLNLALGLARNGARVGYVTVESSDIEITERLLSNESNVPNYIIADGHKLNKEEKCYTELIKAKARMSHLFAKNFTIMYVVRNTCITDLLSLIDMKRRAIGFDVIFVDYLDVISSVTKYSGRPDLEIGEVSVMLQSYGNKHNVAMITAQSFNNEMIKLIKKELLKTKKQSKDPDSEIRDVEKVIGQEGIGGTQKLSRDADYVWGLVLGNKDKTLAVYWMKSRFSKKPDPLLLTAQLDCCKLIEKGSFEMNASGSDDVEELIDDPEILESKNKRAKEEEEAFMKFGDKISENMQEAYEKSPQDLDDWDSSDGVFKI